MIDNIILVLFELFVVTIIVAIVDSFFLRKKHPTCLVRCEKISTDEYIVFVDNKLSQYKISVEENNGNTGLAISINGVFYKNEFGITIFSSVGDALQKIANHAAEIKKHNINNM